MSAKDLLKTQIEQAKEREKRVIEEMKKLSPTETVGESEKKLPQG